MKLLSLTSFLTASGLSMAACCCGGPGSQSSIAFAADAKSRVETIEKIYTVEGMHCGGCRVGVEAALKRVPGVQEAKGKVIDADKKLGQATVRLIKDQDKGHETDCRIVKQIHEDTGYTAYLKGSGRDACNL